MGLKVPSFLYGLVFLVTSPFAGTYRELLQASEQKIPVTQKILRDLGALHQTFLSLRKLKKCPQRENISKNWDRYHLFHSSPLLIVLNQTMLVPRAAVTN